MRNQQISTTEENMRLLAEAKNAEGGWAHPELRLECLGPPGSWGQFCLKNPNCECRGTEVVLPPPAEWPGLLLEMLSCGHIMEAMMNAECDGISKVQALSEAAVHSQGLK